MISSLRNLAFNALAHLLGLVLAVWLSWNIETRFMPVVTDFKLTDVVFSPRGLTVRGTIVKARDCELVNMTIAKIRDGHPALVLDKNSVDLFVPDSSTGLTQWGPVNIPVDLATVDPTDKISVVALHRCHGLWLQRTEYSTLLWQELRNLEDKQKSPVIGRIRYTMRFI